MTGQLVDGKTLRTRPDYRSEKLKIIIGFDGMQHYTKPDCIERDIKSCKISQNLGYKVVRIPYFIQMTNTAVKTLFNVEVQQELFDVSIPSLGSKGQNTPAYLCIAGIERMAMDFRKFPNQYALNIEFLEKENVPFKTGVELLKAASEKLDKAQDPC